MKTSIFFTLAALGFSLLVSADSQNYGFAPSDIITRDIVIIGGGSAGTYAAIRLKDMKQSIVVIEKDVILGGQTDTYIDKGTGKHINIGVEVFHNMSIVKDYFGRFGVPLAGVSITQSSPPVLVDFDTGKAVPSYVSAAPEAVGEAIAKYMSILSTTYLYLAAGYVLPSPVPAELLLPFGIFATNHGLQAMMQTVNKLIQNDGNIWDMPTVQVMAAFDLTLAQTTLGQAFLTTASGDNQDLYTAAAEVLGSDVLYNSTVVHTDRSGKGDVKLIVQTPLGRKLIHAKKLIVTIPPLPSQLSFMDLTHAETRVFSNFQARGYYAGVFSHKGISDTQMYINISPTNPFNLPHLPGLFQISPTGIAHQHSFDFGTLFPVSTADAQAMVTEQIQTLQNAGVFPKDTPEFLMFTNHAPFRLYVDAEEIRKGFYRDLYKLQGMQNTWWTGAAWVTQDSSLIWRFTEALLPRTLAA